MSRSRTRFCSQKGGKKTPPPGLRQCTHPSVPRVAQAWARSSPSHLLDTPPPPAPYLRPHDQRRRSPSRPGLSREGSQTSPRPAATSSNSPSSAGAAPGNSQVQGWRQEGKGAGRGEAPRALPSPGNPLPPTPRRPRSPAQNGGDEKGAGAPTTIHLLRERALAGLVYWSPSPVGQPSPALIGKRLPPLHSPCERPQVEKGSSYWPIQRGPLFRSLASFEDERQAEAPPLSPVGKGNLCDWLGAESAQISPLSSQGGIERTSVSNVHSLPEKIRKWLFPRGHDREGKRAAWRLTHSKTKSRLGTYLARRGRSDNYRARAKCSCAESHFRPRP